MRAVDVIRKKRDGRVLTRAEIQFFVTGITAGTLPDYQASALLMAILLRGMNAEETEGLTDAMVHSGVRVPKCRSAQRRFTRSWPIKLGHLTRCVPRQEWT